MRTVIKRYGYKRPNNKAKKDLIDPRKDIQERGKLVVVPVLPPGIVQPKVCTACGYPASMGHSQECEKNEA